MFFLCKYRCVAGNNQFVWMEDDEFGRQMLAGTNPTVISSLQVESD